MNTRTRVVAVALFAVAAGSVGCSQRTATDAAGGSPAASPSLATEPAPTATPASQEGPPTLATLAAKVGCKPDTDRIEFYAREVGGCEIPEGTFRLITFSSQQGMDNWLKGAEEVGVGVLVVGDLWIANTSGMAVAERVHDALGGEIR